MCKSLQGAFEVWKKNENNNKKIGRIKTHLFVLFVFQLAGDDWDTQTATIIDILFLASVCQWFSLILRAEASFLFVGASLMMNRCSEHTSSSVMKSSEAKISGVLWGVSRFLEHTLLSSSLVYWIAQCSAINAGHKLGVINLPCCH